MHWECVPVLCGMEVASGALALWSSQVIQGCLLQTSRGLEGPVGRTWGQAPPEGLCCVLCGSVLVPGSSAVLPARPAWRGSRSSSREARDSQCGLSSRGDPAALLEAAWDVRWRRGLTATRNAEPGGSTVSAVLTSGLPDVALGGAGQMSALARVPAQLGHGSSLAPPAQRGQGWVRAYAGVQGHQVCKGTTPRSRLAAVLSAFARTDPGFT